MYILLLRISKIQNSRLYAVGMVCCYFAPGFIGKIIRYVHHYWLLYYIYRILLNCIETFQKKYLKIFKMNSGLDSGGLQMQIGWMNHQFTISWVSLGINALLCLCLRDNTLDLDLLSRRLYTPRTFAVDLLLTMLSSWRGCF